MAGLAKYISLKVHSLGRDQGGGKWAQAIIILKKFANRGLSPA